jgi:hypothetical protein
MERNPYITYRKEAEQLVIEYAAFGGKFRGTLDDAPDDEMLRLDEE